MKKLFLLVAIAAITTGVYAQKGAFAGLNFAYNSTWLMNPQVFDDGAGQDIVPSFGHYYGLVLGYNFIDNVGVEVDVNFSKVVQKYTGRLNIWLTDNYNTYNSRIQMNTIDIPLMIRFGEKSYFEMGGVFQIVNAVSYTQDFNDPHGIITSYWYKDLVLYHTFVPEGTIEVQEKFRKNGFGVALGFGSDIDLWEDRLALNFGVRFQYILTDMQGINGLGFDIDSNYVPSDHNDNNEKDRFHTNPLIGGFKIGLKYRIE